MIKKKIVPTSAAMIPNATHPLPDIDGVLESAFATPDDPSSATDAMLACRGKRPNTIVMPSTPFVADNGYVGCLDGKCVTGRKS